MPFQVFGTLQCRETQKLQRWLKERNIPYHFVNIAQKAPSPGELDALAQGCGGWDALVDDGSAVFKKEGFAHRIFDPREELLARPLLMKTPIFRAGRRALRGFDAAALEAFVKDGP